MTKSLRFGLFQSFVRSPGETEHETALRSVAETLYAEALGFDDIWVTDLSAQGRIPFIPEFGPEERTKDIPRDEQNPRNNLPIGVATNPVQGLLAVAFLAAKTSRVRLGTSIVPTPVRHPLDTAAQAAGLDHLCDGRLDLGVGRGTSSIYGPNALEKFARDLHASPSDEEVEAYRRQYYEALDCIVGLVSKEVFDFHGEFYEFVEYSLRPRPYQKPSIPVWAVAQTAQTYPEVGKRGAHLMIPLPGWHGGQTTWESAAAAVGEYRKAWAAAGHPGTPKVAVRTPIFVEETKEAAYDRALDTWVNVRPRMGILASEFETWEEQRTYARLSGIAGIENVWNPEVAVETLVDTMCVWGTPEMVRDQLDRVHETLGATNVMLELPFFTSTFREEHLRTMRLISEYVAPYYA